MYWILFIGIALASWLVQANLKNKFEKYSKIPIDGGLTGRDIAVKMLHDNGIYDVEVVSTSGSLTDHYNPANKTVNLSEDVYDTCSVAAAAVAAHECGHAVQHAHAYAPLKMRSRLVPVISFASNWMMWVLRIGMFTLYLFSCSTWHCSKDSFSKLKRSLSNPSFRNLEILSRATWMQMVPRIEAAM